MPAVNIAPMMDHPYWKTMTPDQRKQALDLWQDPGTSESDRGEMLTIMEQWQSAPVAQAPAPTQPAPGRVDLQGLQADPEFQRLPSQEQQQLLQHGQRQQPTAPAASQATPVSGTVNLDTLKADPEFQALSAQEQAQLLQHAQRSSPTPPRAPQASAPAEEPITPERRFLDLPSIQQLPLEERTQRFKEFYGLPPAFKEEFLRSEEPPSDLVVDIEKPSPPSPTGAAAQTPRAAPISAPAPGPASATRIEPLSSRSTDVLEAEINRPAPLPVPPEAAIAAIPGMAGYAIGARLAPLLGPIGRAVPPLLEAVGGYLGHRANVKLGYEQEGKVGDVLSVLPLVTRSLGGATAGWLERTMKEVPAPVRNQTLDLLGKLFSRGGAPATLTYALSGDPQLAAFVGGSTAVARQLLEFGLRHPAGKQLVETTLKAGRAIGSEELGMLMNIGRTGHTATPHSTRAREGKAPVDLAPMMDHPHWKTLTEAQRKEAISIWQDKDTSDADRAEIRQLMDGWQAEAAKAR